MPETTVTIMIHYLSQKKLRFLKYHSTVFYFKLTGSGQTLFTFYWNNAS